MNSADTEDSTGPSTEMTGQTGSPRRGRVSAQGGKKMKVQSDLDRGGCGWEWREH